jgi:hypothetical protein
VSHCVVDSERLKPVNLGDGVNHVNLSTDVENSVANKMLRVSDPVFPQYRQGPWQLLFFSDAMIKNLPQRVTKIFGR